MSDDLRERLHELGRAAPLREAPDLAAVRARARVRHRRRRVGAALAVVAVIGLGALATTARRDDGRPNPSVVAGPTGTTERQGGPSTEPAGDPLPAGTYVVDRPGSVQVLSPAGEVLRELPLDDGHPLPSSRAMAGTVVVLSRERSVATVLDLRADDLRTVRLTEPLPSDLWTLAPVDGELAIVSTVEEAPYEQPAEVVRWSLRDGTTDTIATLARPGGGRISADERGDLVVETVSASADCAVERVPAGAEVSETLPVPDCVDRAVVVSRDGEALVSYGPAGLQLLDPETGEVTGTWSVEPPEFEGLSLDGDGRHILVGNAYDDEAHGPFLLVDTAAGTVTPLPVRGTAYFVG